MERSLPVVDVVAEVSLRPRILSGLPELTGLDCTRSSRQERSPLCDSGTDSNGVSAADLLGSPLGWNIFETF